MEFNWLAFLIRQCNPTQLDKSINFFSKKKLYDKLEKKNEKIIQSHFYSLKTFYSISKMNLSYFCKNLVD